MPKPIWTGNDVTAYIYAASSVTGEKTSDEPLFSHCFMQDCTVSGSLNKASRPVTGRPKKKIVPQEWGDFELEVGHFYLTKEIELRLDTVFNRTAMLVVEMVCVHEGDHFQDIEEKHTLRRAYAYEFNIAATDNRNVIGTAKFCAEEFE